MVQCSSFPIITEKFCQYFNLLLQVHTEEIQKEAETDLLKLICDTYHVRFYVLLQKYIHVYISRVFDTAFVVLNLMIVVRYSEGLLFQTCAILTRTPNPKTNP